MAKKVGIGYSFKEKSLEKQNEELKTSEKRFKESQIRLVKENEELKAKIEELQKTKELTVTEIKAKLDELGIEYDKKANKETLLTLLPQE